MSSAGSGGADIGLRLVAQVDEALRKLDSAGGKIEALGKAAKASGGGMADLEATATRAGGTIVNRFLGVSAVVAGLITTTRQWQVSLDAAAQAAEKAARAAAKGAGSAGKAAGERGTRYALMAAGDILDPEAALAVDAAYREGGGSSATANRLSAVESAAKASRAGLDAAAWAKARGSMEKAGVGQREDIDTRLLAIARAAGPRSSDALKQVAEIAATVKQDDIGQQLTLAAGHAGDLDVLGEAAKTWADKGGRGRFTEAPIHLKDAAARERLRAIRFAGVESAAPTATLDQAVEAAQRDPVLRELNTIDQQRAESARVAAIGQTGLDGLRRQRQNAVRQAQESGRPGQALANSAIDWLNPLGVPEGGFGNDMAVLMNGGIQGPEDMTRAARRFLGLHPDLAGLGEFEQRAIKTAAMNPQGVTALGPTSPEQDARLITLFDTILTELRGINRTNAQMASGASQQTPLAEH